MTDLAHQVLEDITRMNRALTPTANHAAQVHALIEALRPFVEAYEGDPIADSDCYPEQPRTITVTLGNLRKARMVLREVGR